MDLDKVGSASKTSTDTHDTRKITLPGASVRFLKLQFLDPTFDNLILGDKPRYCLDQHNRSWTRKLLFFLHLRRNSLRFKPK